MKPLAKPESDAYDLTFAEIELQEKTALFTESRVRLASIPLPLQKYEIRHVDERERRNAVVRENVEDDFLGTVITQGLLELNNFAEVDLADCCLDFYPRRTTTLNDFMRENNLAAQPRSGKSTRSIGYAEFEDGFLGGAEYGYHPSLDCSQLMQDGNTVAFLKGLETEKQLFFHREEQVSHRGEELVLFRKPEGAVAGIEYNDYFTSGDLSDELEEIWMRTSGETVVFIDDFMRDYLSKAEKDFGWEMPCKDPGKITFNVIDISGTRAIFTQESVRRDSVPRTLCLYELGDELDGPEDTFKIAKSIFVNFRGTLITERPLDLGPKGETRITPDIIDARSEAPLSLKQFAREVGIRTASPRGHER